MCLSIRLFVCLWRFTRKSDEFLTQVVIIQINWLKLAWNWQRLYVDIWHRMHRESQGSLCLQPPWDIHSYLNYTRNSAEVGIPWFPNHFLSQLMTRRQTAQRMRLVPRTSISHTVTHYLNALKAAWGKVEKVPKQMQYLFCVFFYASVICDLFISPGWISSVISLVKSISVYQHSFVCMQ